MSTSVTRFILNADLHFSAVIMASISRAASSALSLTTMYPYFPAWAHSRLASSRRERIFRLLPCLLAGIHLQGVNTRFLGGYLNRVTPSCASARRNRSISSATQKKQDKPDNYYNRACDDGNLLPVYPLHLHNHVFLAHRANKFFPKRYFKNGFLFGVLAPAKVHTFVFLC